jgi:hypothetical protein
MAILILD